MNLKNYLFLLVLLLAAGVRAQAPSGNAYPKREFRAAWIQAVNGQFRGIPTEKLKQTLVGQLNSLQGAGINAIIFQVRPEADALYASQHEPWSRFLTGTQGQMPSPMWHRHIFIMNIRNGLSLMVIRSILIRHFPKAVSISARLFPILYPVTM